MSTATQNGHPESKPAEAKAKPKTEHANLYEALVAAQEAAKAVAHDARNEHHRYDYTSAEAVIGECRAALNSSGLATLANCWEIKPNAVRVGVNQYGDPVNEIHDAVLVKFTTVHGATGETLAGEALCPIIPGKGRPYDKAMLGAITTATAYYLRGLLQLPRVAEHDDISGRDDSDYQPQRQPSRQQQNRSQRPQRDQQGEDQTQRRNQPANSGDMNPRSNKPATSGSNGQGKVEKAEEQARANTYKMAFDAIVDAATAERIAVLLQHVDANKVLDDKQKAALREHGQVHREMIERGEK